MAALKSKGWTNKLNLISWNGREPKYDIRDWAPKHEIRKIIKYQFYHKKGS